MIYIARYDGYYGSGGSLTEAYEELLDEYSSYVNAGEVEFFEGRKLNGSFEIVEDKPKKQSTREDILDINLDDFGPDKVGTPIKTW